MKTQLISLLLCANISSNRFFSKLEHLYPSTILDDELLSQVNKTESNSQWEDVAIEEASMSTTDGGGMPCGGGRNVVLQLPLHTVTGGMVAEVVGILFKEMRMVNVIAAMGWCK